MNRAVRNSHKILVEIPQENRPLGRPMLTRENNIKTDLGLQTGFLAPDKESNSGF
jgi:hypothetical protein